MEAEEFLNHLRKGPLTFGKMITSLRECDEISQVDLARKMGISRAQLCDIEKERRAVTPAMAAKFAKVMRYSVHQFVALAIEDQLRKAGLKLKVDLKAA
jgi:plasmid maintenance system antidote protein VapI